MPEFITVKSDEQYRIAADLFSEYASTLGIDLCFQHFEEELQSLKIMYGPQKGTIILCKIDDNHLGCVAVRPIDDKIAELKRMYVRPQYQRKGIGIKLLELSLEFAKKAGYRKIRLDTLNTMTPAMNLYLSNGFKSIPAYYHNPEPTAVYFEKEL